MAFRNDQDALRERAEAVERDLARTREELEERDQAATEAEARAAELERELADAHEELARHAPTPVPPEPVAKPSTPGPPIMIVVILGTIAVLAVVAAVLSAPAVTEHERAEPKPAETATPDVPPPPPITVAHEARIREVVAWPPLRPGDACEVESTLQSRGSALDVTRVAVRCGDVALYDSATPATGVVVSSTSSSAQEGPAPRDQLAYTIEYQDVGMRSLPMAQLVLRTRARSARIYREPESAGSVLLEVEPWSVPREGLPLLSTAPPSALVFEESVLRRLAVTELVGAEPVVAGDADCTMSITPEPLSGTFNCRVYVRCGLVDVYGGDESGWNACTLTDGRVSTVDDVSYTDGDPELHFDAAAGTLRVHDGAPEGAWTVDFTLVAE